MNMYNRLCELSCLFFLEKSQNNLVTENYRKDWEVRGKSDVPFHNFRRFCRHASQNGLIFGFHNKKLVSFTTITGCYTITRKWARKPEASYRRTVPISR